ncbi:hypothetical protein [Bermanella sp. R86510]|uniref:hypothetical protein n=1 Tax=unclassified Bermanella TaxID=2627862 RepID=UPI0037CB97FA
MTRQFWMRTLLWLGCVGFSLQLNASEYLLSHVHHVGKTMSALYMKGLSQGSKKYQKDFEQHKQASEETLQQLHDIYPEIAASWQKQWQTFSDHLALNYTEDYGWDIPAHVRRDFRAYHSMVYAFMKEQKTQYTTANQQQAFASAQLEAMAARFFDISSTYNGTTSLSLSDAELLNPKQATVEFKQILNNLISSATNSKEKRVWQSVLQKWEFVEPNVINYSDQGAYFLVYATKNRLHQSLIPQTDLVGLAQ